MSEELQADGPDTEEHRSSVRAASGEQGQLVLASNLAKLLVSSESEGAILGHVTHMVCDREEKAVVAIGFRENIFKDEYLVPVSAVHKIGRDMLMIDTESAMEPMPKHLPAGQMFFKSLTGTMISSLAGNMLGRLSDIAMHQDSWKFNRLYFDQHHWLDVEPESITIGPDQILVPAGATDRIVEIKNQQGWSLARAFEKETYEQITERVQKSFRRRKRDDEQPGIRSSPGLDRHDYD